MPELFIQDQHLISHEEWNRRIGALERGAEPSDAVAAVGAALRSAVLARVPKEGTLGLLFSGGLDCSIIALLLREAKVPFTAITVGFRDGNAKEPEDLLFARKAARLLGTQYEEVLLGVDGAGTVFAETAALLGEELTSVVNLGVGGVEVAAVGRGKELGLTQFMTGLGAEELFAGYDRHERVWKEKGDEALQKECVRGLKAMWAQDLQRDVTIAEASRVEFLTPFLDPELIRLSLAIPAEQKISAMKTYEGRERGDTPVTRPYKKLVLREAAAALGLPHELAWRPKRAAQYGSRLNNALTLLTRIGGFPHKEAYLASLLSPVGRGAD